MSVFDLSVLGVVAFLITIKLLLLAVAAVLAARMLATSMNEHRLAWAQIAVKRAPNRLRS
jgi:hypothetical protein